MEQRIALAVLAFLLCGGVYLMFRKPPKSEDNKHDNHEDYSNTPGKVSRTDE